MIVASLDMFVSLSRMVVMLLFSASLIVVINLHVTACKVNRNVFQVEKPIKCLYLSKVSLRNVLLLCIHEMSFLKVFRMVTC